MKENTRNFNRYLKALESNNQRKCPYSLFNIIFYIIFIIILIINFIFKNFKKFNKC